MFISAHPIHLYTAGDKLAHSVYANRLQCRVSIWNMRNYLWRCVWLPISLWMLCEAFLRLGMALKIIWTPDPVFYLPLKTGPHPYQYPSPHWKTWSAPKSRVLVNWVLSGYMGKATRILSGLCFKIRSEKKNWTGIFPNEAVQGWPIPQPLLATYLLFEPPPIGVSIAFTSYWTLYLFIPLLPSAPPHYKKLGG